jgi:hypothetical protein
MSGNVAMKAPKKQKIKIYTVDTQKAADAAKLQNYLNPLSGYVEQPTSRPRRADAPKRFRYFVYAANPVGGAPAGGLVGFLGGIFGPAAAPAGLPQVPVEIAEGAVIGSQGSLDELVNGLQAVGVGSQDELDAYDERMEQLAGGMAMMGGSGRGRSRRSRRSKRSKRSRKN